MIWLTVILQVFFFKKNSNYFFINLDYFNGFILKIIFLIYFDVFILKIIFLIYF